MIIHGNGSNRLLHWCVCTVLSICRMLWTKMPVTLWPEILLPHQAAIDWLKRDHLHVCLGPLETMMQILMRSWSMTAQQLQDAVVEQLRCLDEWTVSTWNSWLYQTNCLLPVYVEEIHNNNLLDGLYVLMAARSQNAHVVIAHSLGVWSSRGSGQTESGDLLIIALDTGLRQAMPVWVHQLLTCDRSEWNIEPLVIRSRVWDIQEAQCAWGYRPKVNAPPCELITVLSDLFNLPLNIYKQTIKSWMEEHLTQHPTALTWWSMRGQDWQYYWTILWAGCVPEGIGGVGCMSGGWSTLKSDPVGSYVVIEESGNPAWWLYYHGIGRRCCVLWHCGGGWWANGVILQNLFSM